jgi:hypothetical protein
MPSRKMKNLLYFSKKQRKLKKYNRIFNDLNISQLHKTKNSLYCWKLNEDCNVLDGTTVLLGYYTSSNSDNISTDLHILAKGEFLNGKHNGIWRYYDDYQKNIKKEKWRNGKLIYTKKYK